ncbi:MAG: DUF4019 domain-containing protein [Planctomycetota bacterium]
MTIRIAVRAFIGLTLFVMLGGRTLMAQGTDPAAQAAAESWVALIDQGQYASSWEAAAASFKNAVPQQKWAEAVSVARGPFGALKSRGVKSTTATKTLPGAPDGDYVVLQFNTAFEQKAAALETITVLHDPDGQWRVVGYFVR